MQWNETPTDKIPPTTKTQAKPIGTWQPDGSEAISFSFTELLNYRAEGTYIGYVIVTGWGSLCQDGTSFTASGQGVVYSAEGTYLAPNKTTAQGTRIRHNDSQE